jgi:CBS domain-containing protein
MVREGNNRRMHHVDRPLLAVGQVLGSPLLDPSGERLGKVEDLIVRLADGGYPPVTGLKVRIGGRDLFVPSSLVAELAPGSVRLQGRTLDLGRFERRPGEVLLREDVLDRRLIDVVGGRLVNANDLILAHIDDWWHLVGVDPRAGSVFRRLLPRRLRRNGLVKASIIDWRDVEPFVGHVPTARLLMPLRRLKRLHPAQIADLVEHSSHEQGEEIISAVEADPELTADVFEELETDHQLEFLRSRSDEEAANLLAGMAPDDAADLLSELDQERRLAVLNLLPAKMRQKLLELLRYNPETAGGMMSPDYIAVGTGTTLEAALERVRKAAGVPASLLSTVFIVGPDDHLVGGVGVVDLLRGQPEEKVERLEAVVSARVEIHSDLPDVALVMTDYNLTAVPVIDESERLVGAISVDDLLEALVPANWRRRAEASPE